MRRKPRNRDNDSSDQLADLQSKSDQNRVEFLRTDLATVFTFASLVETERSIGNEEHAKRSLADAEKGYATIQKFQTEPKHAKHISDEERKELTAGLERVRKKLDSLRTHSQGK